MNPLPRLEDFSGSSSQFSNSMNTVASAEGREPAIAVLIPCYNEEITIAKVIHQFREQLPSAEIYVFDNNSVDRTVELAQSAAPKCFMKGDKAKVMLCKRCSEKLKQTSM